MKKIIKNIVLIMVTIMLFMVVVSSKSMAVTLSLDNTPKTVKANTDFSIILKFDDDVSAVNAHILYDSKLLTIGEKNEENYKINPKYEEGNAALIYYSYDSTQNELKINAKAGDVTADKNLKIQINDIQLITKSNSTESLEPQSIEIKIEPTSASAEKEDNTMAPKNHAKTGEAIIILSLIVLLIVFCIIARKDLIKALKLFIIIPVLCAFIGTAKDSMAATIDVKDGVAVLTGKYISSKDFDKYLIISPKYKSIIANEDYSFIASENIPQEIQDLNAKIKSSTGSSIALTDRLKTGDIIETYKDGGTTKDKTINVIILGDVNGDGKSCGKEDIEAIANDYINKGKAEGIYRLAANLYTESKFDTEIPRLNVFDINRMLMKYKAQSSDSLNGIEEQTIINDISVYGEESENNPVDDETDDKSDTSKTSYTANDREIIKTTGIEGVYVNNKGKTYKVFSQGYNDVWGSSTFGMGTYATDGAGATCVATIASANNQNVNPEDAGKKMYEALQLENGSVTNEVLLYEGLSKGLEAYGIKNEWKLESTKEEVIEHLKSGQPVIVNVRGTIGSRDYAGHYVTLLGINEQGEIFLGDPASVGKNTGYYDQSKIFTSSNVGVCFIYNN